jgi:hypothetical protein
MRPAAATCVEARDAMRFAVLGIFCFGIIVEPFAIAKALKARALIRGDPSLGGKGVADAALFVAIAALAFAALGLVGRFK